MTDTPETAVEIALLPDEVRILVEHHRTLARTMGTEGNRAAAAMLRDRAAELDLQLTLQMKLRAGVLRTVGLPTRQDAPSLGKS